MCIVPRFVGSGAGLAERSLESSLEPPAGVRHDHDDAHAALARGDGRQAELDDRYGDPAAAAAWIAFGVIAAVIVGYFGWSTVTQSMDAVDIDTTGFQVVDAHSVTVQFQVTLRGRAGHVRARGTGHRARRRRVARRRVPCRRAHSRSFSETIPTVAEATTGLVSSCWIP
jgi:hypothetical protein